MFIDPIGIFTSGVETWMKLERGRITREEYEREMSKLVKELREANDAWEAAGK